MVNVLAVNRMRRVRRKIKSVSCRMRLSIHKSNKYLYAQIINDSLGTTVAAASTLEIRDSHKNAKSVAAATELGILIAMRALNKRIDSVVFDRGRFMYHGAVKAVAEAARVTGMYF